MADLKILYVFKLVVRRIFKPLMHSQKFTFFRYGKGLWKIFIFHEFPKVIHKYSPKLSQQKDEVFCSD